MAPLPVEIDIAPDGDVKFVLENPDAPFAVWKECPGVFTGTDANGDASQSPRPPLVFKMSSRKLERDSDFLRGLFDEQRAANQPLVLTGKGWDIDAFMLVMTLVHGCAVNVPTTISVELLAKVAAIADAYKLRGVVQEFGQDWLYFALDDMPKTYCRELILWIYIAMVFDDHYCFYAATHLAILHNNGWWHSLGLPFPPQIGEEILVARATIISDAVKRMHLHLKRLVEDESGCSMSCRLTELGAMAKTMVNYGILNPASRYPATIKTVAEVLAMWLNTRSPSWCTIMDGSGAICPDHACPMAKELMVIYAALNKSIYGLALARYVPRPAEADGAFR